MLVNRSWNSGENVIDGVRFDLWFCGRSNHEVCDLRSRGLPRGHSGLKLKRELKEPKKFVKTTDKPHLATGGLPCEPSLTAFRRHVLWYILFGISPLYLSMVVSITIASKCAGLSLIVRDFLSVWAIAYWCESSSLPLQLWILRNLSEAPRGWMKISLRVARRIRALIRSVPVVGLNQSSVRLCTEKKPLC